MSLAVGGGTIRTGRQQEMRWIAWPPRHRLHYAHNGRGQSRKIDSLEVLRAAMEDCAREVCSNMAVGAGGETGSDVDWAVPGSLQQNISLEV